MLKFALRQTCALKGVAIYKWFGYSPLVWLFTIYQKGAVISFSISTAPVGAKKYWSWQKPYTLQFSLVLV